MPDGAGYDTDFFLWSREQAERLRAAASLQTNLGIDWENVAEEIESLSKRDRRELESRLDRTYEHLLKLAYSPAIDPREGWIRTVHEQRRAIRKVLRDSPTLRNHVRVWIAEDAADVRATTAKELMSRGEIEAAVLSRLDDGGSIVELMLDEEFIPDRPHPIAVQG